MDDHEPYLTLPDLDLDTCGEGPDCQAPCCRPDLYPVKGPLPFVRATRRERERAERILAETREVCS
jgi:hypothetical protein